MSDRTSLSVVIPVLDEATRLPALLADLAAAPPELALELWVVDGGSCDGSAELAALAGARVLRCRPGRGEQICHGIRLSHGTWLLLLHADVRLPPLWWQLLLQAMADDPESAWAFPLAIEGAGPCLGLVALLTNLRCRLRQLPYGDQGLLLSRAVHDRVGGLAPLPLMEDLEFVLRLREAVRIRLLRRALSVDGRRWRRLGILATTWTNWQLRRAWRGGAHPGALARIYGGRNRA